MKIMLDVDFSKALEKVQHDLFHKQIVEIRARKNYYKADSQLPQ